MLPVRFILINSNNLKAVFKLEVKAVVSELRLEYSLHQFKGALTDSIVETFNTNTSNLVFFKSLPIEMLYSQEISLHDSEQLYFYLQQAQEYIQSTGTIPQLQLGTLNLYLDQQQIYSFQNFVLQFNQTYEVIKLNLQILTNRNDQNNQRTVSSDVIPQNTPIESTEPRDNTADIKLETPEIQEGEIEDVTVSLLNDALKLSPTPLCTYYISKFISNIFNAAKYEKVEITANENGIVNISFSPLISHQMIFVQQYQQTILNIIDSFNYSNDEYISKLKMLVNELVFIINTYYGKPEIKKLFIVLKIIEFLIYIYSIKMSPQVFLSKLEVNVNSVDFKDKSNFNTSLLKNVNYTIAYILSNYYDLSKINYNRIVIAHFPEIILDEEELALDKLKTVLTKELYLLDIDKDNFINRVFSQVNKEVNNGVKSTSKLILQSSKTIDLTKFIDESEESTSMWLSYKLITPKQKQFETNKIITEEYLQILQIINAPSIASSSIINKVNPIIARYADTIANIIFKELSNIDSSVSISTLNLLNTYIRPYLNEDSTVNTELFILYRIVLPHIYDTFGITTFIDYFH